MAKAKFDVESVNVVSKDVGLSLLSIDRVPSSDSTRDRNHPNVQTLKHSRFQTLEEILYSLDTDNQRVRKNGTSTMKDTSAIDVSAGSSNGHHSKDITSHKHDLISHTVLSEHTDNSETVKLRKSRLKDPAVVDFDAWLNDDSDIDDAVSIEDLQARRRLLDYQLQRRIEQYYLEDLDLESLNAEDFPADFRFLDGSRNLNPPKPDYPESSESEEECSICLEVLVVQKRWCCQFPVCTSCMDQYLEIKVSMGVVKISCINGACSSYIHREEIYERLSHDMKEKFYRYLVNANQDPHIKTCPKCSHVYNENDLGSDNRQRFGRLVVCPECKLNWCFYCHAPWHAGTRCEDFQKGDKLVKHWAKEQHFGVNNAQKCPNCKIFIERKGGCDHMTCTRCNTGFCYRCGDRYRDLKIFGNHLSRYSIVGCKYNYLPNHTAARRFCRGSIFGLELLGGVVLLGLGIAAAGLLLGTSVIILPAFGGYKYHKRRKIRRRMKRQEELFKMRTRNAMVEMQRERAVLERYTEKFSLQAGSTDGDLGSVHIGIQTERSQNVDVTVHNPSATNSASNSEQTVDSKICMNISDERGQVTVTTAEITHNASKGEGSEAEVVLHVRTTYTNVNKDVVSEGNPVQTDDNEKQVNANSVNELIKESKSESNLRIPDAYSMSDAHVKHTSSDSATLSLPHTKHNRTASLPVKSDLVKNKENVKFNLCKTNFRCSDRSRKHSRAKDIKSNETDSQNTVNDQTPKCSDEKASDDQDENLENEALSQSGCFLKLFSRKLNTLQNQLGKEREKNSLTRSLSEPIDYTNCPDLMSCIIASELKNRENKEENKEQDRETVSVQQAEAIVAKETCSTSF